MAEVIAMLEEFRGIAPLTAEAAAARFLAHGWTPGGKTRDGVETSWDKGSVGGWIRTFDGGAVSVSFFVWIRDVDESGYFDDLDAVYEQGEQVLADFLPEIEESRLAGHLIEAEQTEADRDEFIRLKKWTLDGRFLTAGVIQHDTDLPVMVMVVLSADERQWLCRGPGLTAVPGSRRHAADPRGLRYAHLSASGQ